MNAKKNVRTKQKKLQDLICEVCTTDEEKELSEHMFDLIKSKKIIAVRVLTDRRKELFLELEDGTGILINNFVDKYDISVS